MGLPMEATFETMWGILSQDLENPWPEPSDHMCSIGLGPVLSQDTKIENTHYYTWTKNFSGPEERYAFMERELLVIKWTIEAHRHFLFFLVIIKQAINTVFSLYV